VTAQIAEALDANIDTIARTRQLLLEEGVDPPYDPQALAQAANPSSHGNAEAKRIAFACSPPPKGRKRWALTLLEATVELNIVDRVNDNTIGRTLKDTVKPHLQKQWVISPEDNAAIVASMEDVLEVYQRPHDQDRPMVCQDETTKQPVKETRVVSLGQTRTASPARLRV
jgi:hypothetical protein